MKNFIFGMILTIGLMLSMPPAFEAQASPPDQTCFVIDYQCVAPAVLAQETGGVVVDPATPAVVPVTPGNFFLENWVALLFGLMGFIELIVRLTPSEKDNSIFNWIFTLLNALLPNLKKGGGTFKVSSK